MRYGIFLAVVLLGGASIGALDEAEATKQEMAKLQGTWQVESLIEDGQSPPAEVVKTMRLVINGDRWAMKAGDELIASGTFRIDPAKHTIERVHLDGQQKGQKFHGIYKLQADSFHTCWSPVEKERPTEFSGKAGSGCELDQFRRAK
jgi:uncharacterized protein (TIGR03067 family)